MAAKKTSKDKQITVSRVIDAPVERVFKAFTEPEQIKYWWGPRGFTNTIYKREFKVGGVWEYMMHGPDGVNYPNRVQYTEIKPNELISYIHGDNKIHDQFTANIRFASKGNKTQVTLQIIAKTAAQIAGMKKFGAVEGGNENLARLAEHLTKTQEQIQDEFFISRVFDAPRDLVWKAFSEEQRLGRWWGPAGFFLRSAKLQFKPNGYFHFNMVSADGKNSMWAKFTYKDIQPKERIVYINSFSDEKGNIVKPPFPNWPKEMYTQITLVELRGKTVLELRSYPVNASKEERETFRKGRASMQQGFGGTFNQLAKYVAQEQRPKRYTMKVTDRTIMQVCTLNAPVARVYKVYTDPKSIPKWWGPKWLTTTVEKMDVSVAGRWKYVQKDKDNNVFSFNGIYTRIVPNKELTYTFEFEGTAGHVLVEHVQFDTVRGKTRVTVTTVFENNEDRDGMINAGMEEGSMDSWDQLAGLVEK
jgi:uncharacterized protein YndB with AHSA1/START domain